MAIQFKLIRIDVPQFAILKDESFQPSLQVNLEVGFAVNARDHMIKNTVKVLYTLDALPVSQIVVDCYFEVSETSWQEFIGENGIITIPLGFLQHMSTITVGTTRGELHARFEGTNLSRVVFPLINLTEIIKEDLVLNPKGKE